MATEFINGQWRIPNSWNVDESNQGKVSNYSMKFNNASTNFIQFPETDFLKSGQASFSFGQIQILMVEIILDISFLEVRSQMEV